MEKWRRKKEFWLVNLRVRRMGRSRRVMHMQVGPMYLKDRVVMTIAEEESMRGCHVCVVCVCV